MRTFLGNPGSGELRITVNSRCRSSIREFGFCGNHDPQEHHSVSDLPIEADNQAISVLRYWL